MLQEAEPYDTGLLNIANSSLLKIFRYLLFTLFFPLRFFSLSLLFQLFLCFEKCMLSITAREDLGNQAAQFSFPARPTSPGRPDSLVHLVSPFPLAPAHHPRTPLRLPPLNL